MIDSYVCIDLETTGLNPKQDKIIEIGAVKVENGIEKERFAVFVDPGRRLTEKITELTGIRDEDLAEAPDIREVIPRIIEFTEGFVLLGHSVLFDYSFLKKAAVNERLEFERNGIDTLKIARKYLSGLESRSLDNLCLHYRIPHKAHRALEDAVATCALYERLAEEFGRGENEKDFLPGPLIYHAKRETPATRSQKERLCRLLLKHKIEIEYDTEKLTRNEASRYTDQILAKYGQ